MFKAVFFDRDGVINQAITINGRPYPPKSIDQLRVDQNVNSLLCQLKAQAWLLFVVTNQPDVARKKTAITEVEKINLYLRENLPIDDIEVCFHDDDDHCDCRKPKAGMLHKLAAVYNVDLKASFMVGDRWRDICAGLSAGCKTIFIDHSYDEKQPSNFDHRVASLETAVNIILNEKVKDYE